MFSYKIKLFSEFNKAFGFAAAGALLNQSEGKEKSETDIKMSNKQKNIETGLDRIKKLFSLRGSFNELEIKSVIFIYFSEYNEMHPDMVLTTNVFGIALVAGFIYGGFKEYNKAYEYFLQTNDTTKFLNQNDARRRLANYTTQAFLKGGLAYGPKFAVLVGSFFLTSSTVALYRGKYGILEYSVAGAITSSLRKFNLGIKGMFSGSITGGLAGTVLGTFVWLSAIISGKSMSDVRNYTYLVSLKNVEKLAEIEEKDNEKLSL